jgi:flagellar biosynthesis/type III secretory pathway protein FliH
MQVIHEESKDDSHGVIHQIDEEITRLKEREQKVTT